jgi:hypothetical protein
MSAWSIAQIPAYDSHVITKRRVLVNLIEIVCYCRLELSIENPDAHMASDIP